MLNLRAVLLSPQQSVRQRVPRRRLCRLVMLIPVSAPLRKAPMTVRGHTMTDPTNLTSLGSGSRQHPASTPAHKPRGPPAGAPSRRRTAGSTPTGHGRTSTSVCTGTPITGSAQVPAAAKVGATTAPARELAAAMAGAASGSARVEKFRLLLIRRWDRGLQGPEEL
ncbi:hypothetical protein PLESTF_001451300 [Pleodorina starrii]|nr:hypothetical protein PLESTF_001451300 [Pleodorina starrii]